MFSLDIILAILLSLNLIESGFSATDSSVCYKVLGCFNITDEFKHIIYRPINLLPESPERVNTKVIFYTQNDRKTGQLLNQNWLNTDNVQDKLIGFDGNKQTKFIVHGYLDNFANGKWMSKLKDEFFINGDHNVFIVDWSDGNGMPYYQAAANCRVVGAQIALLINNLNNYSKIRYDQVHIIGHSLGAHLAGYTGHWMKKLSKKIGRITALDPAEPLFQYMPNSVRLDRTDAEFVDVLHTDSKSILQFGLGMSQPIGHIDFYPNGGNDQPGCSVKRVETILNGDMAEATRKFVACNHDRAIDYFIESINSDRNGCQFTAYSCGNWTAFANEKKCNSCGKTGGLCAQMGNNAVKWKNFKNNKKSKLFYLRTNSEQPFCGFQLKIEIPVQSIDGESASYSGKMKLKLNSGSDTYFAFLESLNISPNVSYDSVITLRKKDFFSTLDSVEFEWSEEEFDIFDPSSWRLSSFFNRNREQNNKIHQKEIFVKDIHINPLFKSSGNRLKLKKFCNKNPNSGIKPEKSIKFNKNC